MTSSSRGPVGAWLERIFSPNGFEVALRLTLVGLLLQPVGSESIRPWILCVVVVGLVVPRLVRRAELWGTLAVLTGLRVVLDWPLGDNHSYLLFYWCLAASLSLCAKDVERSLAKHGRWLVGLVFTFAVVWKGVLSPEFADGTFFSVMLLTDPRLEDLVRVATGLPIEAIEIHRHSLMRHADGIMIPVSGLPRLPESFERLVTFMTRWTLGIEALIAVLFLWPQRRGSSMFRDIALLTFCATTYAFAPVVGFGWLVIAMGVAQCDPEQGRMRACYVACFGLILFYREVPWVRLLADSLASA